MKSFPCSVINLLSLLVLFNFLPYILGGIFGLFDGKIDHIVKKNPTTNQVIVEKDTQKLK